MLVSRLEVPREGYSKTIKFMTVNRWVKREVVARVGCGMTTGRRQGGFWLEEEARCELVGNDIFQNQKSGIQARLRCFNDRSQAALGLAVSIGANSAELRCCFSRPTRQQRHAALPGGGRSREHDFEGAMRGAVARDRGARDDESGAFARRLGATARPTADARCVCCPAVRNTGRGGPPVWSLSAAGTAAWPPDHGQDGRQVGGHANPNVVRNIVRDGMKGGIVVHDQVGSEKRRSGSV